MKKIDVPEINQVELCNSFSSLNYLDRIIEMNNQYEERINDLNNFNEDEIKFINTNLDYKDYMKKIYSSRFSNKSYPNQYKFYIKIRSSQKYCPYCNYPTREVKQVDHYLPKSKFPSLALVVKNLVPICKDCNEKKGDYFSLDKNNQFIHPYFDNGIENSFKFIECEIIEDEKIGFKFKIKKLDEWDEAFFGKVKFHFNKLEIDKLYLADFINDYDVTISELGMLYKLTEKNKEMIITILKNKINVYYQKKIMSWRYAGYKAILSNEWFWQSFFDNMFKEDMLT